MFPSNTTNQSQQYNTYAPQTKPTLPAVEEKSETIEDEFFYSGDIESIETPNETEEEGLDAFNTPELTF